MRKRVLLIGFEPAERIEYPHVQCVADYLARNCDFEYRRFRERGYFTGLIFQRSTWWLRPAFFLLLWRVLLDFLSGLLAALKGYDSIIVIDNYAYALMGLIRKRDLVLWSLDFVTPDQATSRSIWQQAVARLCARALRAHKKILIQDENRLRLLLRSIGLEPGEPLSWFFLPVSLHPVAIASPATMKPSMACRSLPSLLQIGGINEHRSCSRAIFDNYRSNPHCYSLRLHGYISPNDFPKEDLDRYPVVFSTHVVSSERVPDIVADADIGLVAYCSHDDNFRYLKNASGQLVEYLRCAKPIIVYSSSDLCTFIEDSGAGVAIDSLDELPSAIDAICRDYRYFSQRSLFAFQNHYDFSLFSDSLLRWLDSA